MSDGTRSRAMTAHSRRPSRSWVLRRNDVHDDAALEHLGEPFFVAQVEVSRSLEWPQSSAAASRCGRDPCGSDPPHASRNYSPDTWTPALGDMPRHRAAERGGRRPNFEVAETCIGPKPDPGARRTSAPIAQVETSRVILCPPATRRGGAQTFTDGYLSCRPAISSCCRRPDRRLDPCHRRAG